LNSNLKEENESFNKNQILLNDSILNSLEDIKKKNKSKIKKILLIGRKPNNVFKRLNKIFPEAYHYITSPIDKDLINFEKQFGSKENYVTSILEIFKGKSLFDFTLKYNRFDLIIILNLHNYSQNITKIKHSIQFIYIHLLKRKGYLCIIKYSDNIEINRLFDSMNLKIINNRTRISNNMINKMKYLLIKRK